MDSDVNVTTVNMLRNSTVIAIIKLINTVHEHYLSSVLVTEHIVDFRQYKSAPPTRPNAMFIFFYLLKDTQLALETFIFTKKK
jgi:hypothetical protein